MAEHGKEPEAEAGGGEGPSRADPAAVALALGRASRGGKAIDEEAGAYLRDQRKLVNLQMEHLHEERELQHRHGRLKFFSERLKVGLQLLTMLVGLALAIGAGLMVWDAAHENGLVIEAFTVPPALAQRGLTGEVVASKLLDEINAMDAMSDSVRAPSSYANNWTNNISVEIPETGVSIGEVRSLLIGWLGHQTHIRGEVYQSALPVAPRPGAALASQSTPSGGGMGLVVAARSGSAAAIEHAGADADLNTLIHAAAEDVYRSTQPYRYAIYLVQTDRRPLARETFEALVPSASASERAWAYIGLANSEPDWAGQMGDERRARDLDPNLTLVWSNLATSQSNAGEQQDALASRTRALAVLNCRDHGGVRASAVESLRHAILSDQAADVGDFAKAVSEMDLSLATQTSAASRSRGVVFRITSLAKGHDLAGARAAIPAGEDDAATARAMITNGCCWAPRADVDEMLEDWGAAYAQLLGIQAVQDDPALLARYPALRRGELTMGSPRIATALAHLGRLDEARALIGQTPESCYRCVVARGLIAALAGDAPGADRWFAQALRQGPSLPFAETEWGKVLLTRGDAAGAIAKATLASRKGPRFADPLELWGEALLKQGSAKAAEAKFAAADKLAPKWGRNHLLWGEALAKQGKTAEARVQFAAASGLDLTAGERAELAKAQAQAHG